MTSESTLRLLQDLLDRQHDYNEKIRLIDPDSKEVWTQTYLMGLVHEINGVLAEINWKKHRKGSIESPDITNLAFKFADLQKYVLSLWELWGFTADDLYYYSLVKSDMVELQSKQEGESIMEGVPVVITDLDGTGADWRGSFIKWMRERSVDPIIDDPVTSLMMDHDLSLRYPEYYELKREFESSGQYEHLLPYGDWITTINHLKFNRGAYIIASTARPFNRYKRIWMDTWRWIRRWDVLIDQLNMTSDARILTASKIAAEHKVIMFEDDPEIMIRGANCGIQVFARKHPYNSQIVHKNIMFVDKYTDLTVDDYFPKQE